MTYAIMLGVFVVLLFLGRAHRAVAGHVLAVRHPV